MLLVLPLSTGKYLPGCGRFALGAGYCLGCLFGIEYLAHTPAHLVHAIHQGADDRKSNADALLGQVGEVTQTIVAGDYGRVKLDGDDWKAEAPSSSVNIEVGTKVKIVGREFYYSGSRKAVKSIF